MDGRGRGRDANDARANIKAHTQTHTLFAAAPRLRAHTHARTRLCPCIDHPPRACTLHTQPRARTSPRLAHWLPALPLPRAPPTQPGDVQESTAAVLRHARHALVPPHRRDHRLDAALRRHCRLVRLCTHAHTSAPHTHTSAQRTTHNAHCTQHSTYSSHTHTATHHSARTQPHHTNTRIQHLTTHEHNSQHVQPLCPSIARSLFLCLCRSLCRTLCLCLGLSLSLSSLHLRLCAPSPCHLQCIVSHYVWRASET